MNFAITLPVIGRIPRMGRAPSMLALGLLVWGWSLAVCAEVGVTADDILIGQSAALAGPAAELGTQMRVGAQVYFRQINQKGGVFKRELKLSTLDDGYEPSRAVANTKKLIEEEKVFALFGYIGTPTANAALPLVTAAKVPFFAPVTGADSMRKPVNRYVFNIRASFADETERIVEHLAATGVRNIAVFYENDEYGSATLDAVAGALAKRNLKVVSKGAVVRNTTNVAEAVKAILPGKPTAIIMSSAYKSSAEFVRQARKAGYAGMFFNVSFVGSSALAEELGNEGVGVAISQVVPFPWGANLPVVREYQTQMKENSAADLSFSGLEGYIAAKIFVEALKRAGKDLTREKFIAALDGMDSFDVGGFVVSFSPANHSGSKFVDLTIIGRDRKFRQ